MSTPRTKEAVVQMGAGCHMSVQGACSRPGHLPSHAGLRGGARALGQCLGPQRPAKSGLSRSSKSFLEATRAFKELAAMGAVGPRQAVERCRWAPTGQLPSPGPPGTPGRCFPYSLGQFHSVNSYLFSAKRNVIKTFAQHLVRSSGFPS